MIFTGDIAQPYIGASTVNIPEVFCKSAWFGNLEGSFVEGEGFTGVYMTPEDVKAVAMEVLRHRIILSYEAEAEEVSAETVVQKILDSVEVP